MCPDCESLRARVAELERERDWVLIRDLREQKRRVEEKLTEAEREREKVRVTAIGQLMQVIEQRDEAEKRAAVAERNFADAAQGRIEWRESAAKRFDVAADLQRKLAAAAAVLEQAKSIIPHQHCESCAHFVRAVTTQPAAALRAVCMRVAMAMGRRCGRFSSKTAEEAVDEVLGTAPDAKEPGHG